MRPEQAQQLLAQLRNDYIAELSNTCAEIENLILMLGEAVSKDVFDNLYRHVHSVKGTAGTHGLNIISSICHELEEQLNKIDLNDQQCVDADNMLEYVDLIERAVSVAESDSSDYLQIESDLDALRKKVLQDLSPVLLVESSDTVKSICKQALERLPVELTMVSDGLEGLGLLLRAKYKVVITAREVKTLNGPGLISALQASESVNHNIKSILLTSRAGFKLNKCNQPDFIIGRDKDFNQNLAKTVATLIK